VFGDAASLAAERVLSCAVCPPLPAPPPESTCPCLGLRVQGIGLRVQGIGFLRLCLFLRAHEGVPASAGRF